MIGADFWTQVQPSLRVEFSTARTYSLLTAGSRNRHAQRKLATNACVLPHKCVCVCGCVPHEPITEPSTLNFTCLKTPSFLSCSGPPMQRALPHTTPACKLGREQNEQNCFQTFGLIAS